MTTTFVQANQGVQFLKHILRERYDEFIEQFDLDILDMSHGGKCVLGQLDAFLKGIPMGTGSFASYSVFTHPMSHGELIDLGFTVETPDTMGFVEGKRMFASLTATWALLITSEKERIDSGKLSTTVSATRP